MSKFLAKQNFALLKRKCFCVEISQITKNIWYSCFNFSGEAVAGGVPGPGAVRPGHPGDEGAPQHAHPGRQATRQRLRGAQQQEGRLGRPAQKLCPWLPRPGQPGVCVLKGLCHEILRLIWMGQTTKSALGLILSKFFSSVRKIVIYLYIQ